jgi:hypothetical protein
MMLHKIKGFTGAGPSPHVRIRGVTPNHPAQPVPVGPLVFGGTN